MTVNAGATQRLFHGDITGGVDVKRSLQGPHNATVHLYLSRCHRRDADTREGELEHFQQLS